MLEKGKLKGNSEVSGALSTALEKPKDKLIHTPGRTHNRIRSPRLVVVANIQMRTLKTEVEKGSM